MELPCINSEAGLKRIADAKCRSVDYVCVSNCSDCTQSSFEAAFENVQNLTGFGLPTWFRTYNQPWSILLAASPGITSLRPLRRVQSLMGGVLIRKMDGLSDLHGLEEIEVVSSGIDSNYYPTEAAILPFDINDRSLAIVDNPNLKSARAFENVHVWGKVAIYDNPSLCDLPSQFHSGNGNEILNSSITSSCVHGQTKRRKKIEWLVVGVGITTAFAVLSFVIYLSKHRRTKQEELKHEEQEESEESLLGAWYLTCGSLLRAPTTPMPTAVKGWCR
jgi:hypothetical protein